jgi:hypothetical protein
MGVFEKETGGLVGGSGFARIMPNLREAEVGYWIRGSCQRRGYCTEATRGLISQGLTPADRGGWGLRRPSRAPPATTTSSASASSPTNGTPSVTHFAKQLRPTARRTEAAPTLIHMLPPTSRKLLEPDTVPISCGMIG